MTAESVAEVIGILDDAGIQVWLDGGWGVAHGVRFDARGYGRFLLPDGREWPFPPPAFAGRGTVGGRPVWCLSPEAQVQCHGQGYVPTAKDLADMARLQARFEVVLPLSLCVASEA
jgi:hypothetical protein